MFCSACLASAARCQPTLFLPTHSGPLPPPQEVILIENDINTNPFTPAVYDCVPPLPWSVSPADLADPRRMDLRCVGWWWGLRCMARRTG